MVAGGISFSLIISSRSLFSVSCLVFALYHSSLYFALFLHFSLPLFHPILSCILWIEVCSGIVRNDNRLHLVFLHPLVYISTLSTCFLFHLLFHSFIVFRRRIFLLDFWSRCFSLLVSYFCFVMFNRRKFTISYLLILLTTIKYGFWNGCCNFCNRNVLAVYFYKRNQLIRCFYKITRFTCPLKIEMTLYFASTTKMADTLTGVNFYFIFRTKMILHFAYTTEIVCPLLLRLKFILHLSFNIEMAWNLLLHIRI